LHAHDVLISRRDRVEAELATLAAESRCAATVARLRCLRGIDTLSALGLCAEIGEWERFDHPDQLAAYVGIVPSEHTSGERRRQGSITKAGSTHARRLLIEASYHYRRQPGVGLKLERRQRDQPPEIINIAWRAATTPERPLATAQRRPPQAQRDRRGRDRPRARLLLLGDRNPSGHGSAGSHAGGRPPHARNPRPAQAEAKRQEDQRLALTPTDDRQPVAAGEAARAPRHRAHQSAACP
ncbi:MAG: transposase, partial [Solirubrobacteraceae bacterium]